MVLVTWYHGHRWSILGFNKSTRYNQHIHFYWAGAIFYVNFYSNNIRKFQSSQLTTVLESAMFGVVYPFLQCCSCSVQHWWWPPTLGRHHHRQLQNQIHRSTTTTIMDWYSLAEMLPTTSWFLVPLMTTVSPVIIVNISDVTKC